MLKICLAFWKSELQYAYKRYAYKKTCIGILLKLTDTNLQILSKPQEARSKSIEFGNNRLGC